MQHLELGTAQANYSSNCDIYTMPVDGSDRTNVTNTPTADDDYPSWQSLP